jgi:protein prenyltransferase alpha subunit repeat containing protein 1
MINADHYTAWNIRKRLIISQIVTAQEEWDLIDLIFTKHPKSSEAWAHRYFGIRAVNAAGGGFEAFPA